MGTSLSQPPAPTRFPARAKRYFLPGRRPVRQKNNMPRLRHPGSNGHFTTEVRAPENKNLSKNQKISLRGMVDPPAKRSFAT